MSLVRKASFGRKPRIGMNGAKVRAQSTLAQPTRPTHLNFTSRCQFYFTISDVDVELDSANHLEELLLVWRRGHKVVSSQHATVVEKLDHSSGALSRTARLRPDLSLLCTLFSTRGGGKLELKHSELELQEGSGSIICSVPLELSQHAGRAGVPPGASSEGGHGGGQLSGPGKALVLAMPNGVGTLRFTLRVRRLAAAAGAVDDGMSDASSQAPDRNLRACPAQSCGGAGPCAGSSGEHASACAASAASVDAVEQRWQEVQFMERAREDAATVKALQADLGALIQENKRFKEELLAHKKRGVFDAMPSSRRELVEQVPQLCRRRFGDSLACPAQSPPLPPTPPRTAAPTTARELPQVASLRTELACAKLEAKKEAAAVEERQVCRCPDRAPQRLRCCDAAAATYAV